MSMSKAATAALAGAAAMATAAAAHAERNCFFTTQWNNSRAVSPTVIYLRVNVGDIYRLTLAGSGSYQLQDPSYHLVNIVRGSSTICSAIDLDLRVANGNGYSAPVIAKSLEKLTTEEAAALPKKDRP